MGALQAAVNVDSVASFGFFGSDLEKVWARSLTEGFYLWDWAAACSEVSEGASLQMLPPPSAFHALPCLKQLVVSPALSCRWRGSILGRAEGAGPRQ